jgi:uncharacterized protein (UPF0332 family)
MKDESTALFEKASRAIEAAETLLESGYAEFATGRAYYSMFYVAEALLNEKNLQFSKHSGVHGAFGEHFIKTGIFDSKFHRWLLDAFDQRIEGDYSADIEVTPQDARELIDQAKAFLEIAKQYLADQER